MSSAETTTEHRGIERYHVRWKIALVFDELDHQNTYHGRTYDLSLSGTAMLTDVNILATAPVVILLAPPPLIAGHDQKLIEIQARQIYAVYSGEASCFRLGFQFITFKGNGFAVLKERLTHHQPKTYSKRPEF